MEVDFSDPVARRAYLEELRRERLVEEEAQEAREQRRWVQETEPELSDPYTKQASVRAPRGAPDDAAIRSLIRAEIAAAVRDLLNSVGQAIAEERATHRRALRRVTFELRDLRRAVRKQEQNGKIRMVA
jgi:hypothetical protein